MAINPESQYPGKINPSSEDYPYGSAKNVTVAGDGTGTPWEAALVNDVFGFQQAILDRASVVPTGTPETAQASQYWDALQAALFSGEGLISKIGNGLGQFTLNDLINAPALFFTGRAGTSYRVKTFDPEATWLITSTEPVLPTAYGFEAANAPGVYIQLDTSLGVNIKQLGAIDSDKFDFFLANSGPAPKLEKGVTYTLTRAHTVPEYVHLDLGGGEVVFEVDGAVECLVLSDFSSVRNGTIEVDGTNGTGLSGQYQSPILVGDFFNPISVQGWSASDLTLKSNKPNSNGISVLGNCFDGSIERIKSDGQAAMGRVVLLHWGNTQALPAGGSIGNTGHPHDITVDGITAVNGEKTETDAFVVFISGGYNIDVKNIDADGHYGCYQVSAGEPSNGYATSTIKPKILNGLTTHNLTANRCVQPYKLSGLGKDGVQPVGQPAIGSIVMTETFAYNTDGSGTSSALVSLNWSRAQLIGGKIENFDFYGMQSKFQSTYFEVSGFKISGCGYPGVSVEGESGFRTQAVIKGNNIQQNGQTGATDAQTCNINLNWVEGVSITDSNKLGATSGETAVNHVYASNNSLKVTVDDNVIRNTASGAALKSERSATPSNAFFSQHVAGNNRYDSGVTPTEGGWCVEIKSGKPVALVPSSATPGSGDGEVGYEVEFTDAGAGAYKRQVKVDATTWKGYAQIEV